MKKGEAAGQLMGVGVDRFWRKWVGKGSPVIGLLAGFGRHTFK